MRIAVLDCHQENYSEMAKRTVPGKKKYCKLHGYDFIFYKFEDLESYNFKELQRFPTWGRVPGLTKFLPEYHWILYLDTDTLIANFDTKIEDQIDDQFCVLVGAMPDFYTGEPTHLSTSAILIKNDKRSFDFLHFWWTQDQFDYRPYFSPKPNGATANYGGMFYEQSAFHHIYDNTGFKSIIKVMPNCWFNSREVNYKEGDFLIHFASSRYSKMDRLKKFLKDYNKITGEFKYF